MGPLAKFLLALTNLVRSGGIKKISDAIRFAKQEFGEVTPLLRKQIQKVFESAKKPVVGKPGKKEGAVIPMVKEGAKKAEGIETLEDSSPLMDRLDKKVEEMRLSDDDPMGDLEQILNPRRPGGSLDPAIGITRGLARKILDRKGIEIGKKDPIDVFTDTFGEAITDVKNLADEMVEADEIGRNLKSPDELLEIEGLFDIEIPKNPQRGLTDDEMIEMLEKDLKEKEILEDFDPTFRKPNAEGGLTRTSYAMGKGPVLPSDEDPINPFQPTPTGPVLPDKMAGTLGDESDDISREMFGKPVKDLNPSELEELMEELERLRNKFTKGEGIMMASGYGSFKDFVESTGDGELMELYSEFLETGDDARMMLRLKKLGYDMRDDIATGGRVQAASGGLAEILKL